MNTATNFDILSDRYSTPEPNAVTLDDVKKAEEIINQTDCFHPTGTRFQALNVMKAATDRISESTYTEFCEKGVTIPKQSLEETYSQYPALYWYDHSFQKILDGVKNDTVPAGQIFIWLVYNMGYVIKTPTKCFAIDLHHRRAEELAPYLDFCCVTHNHDDHYTERFTSLMNKLHKPVITNFLPNTGYEGIGDQAGYSKKSTRTLDFGDVVITTFESDHNNKLRKFVQPVQVICKTGDKNCVLFSSGDTCNPEQLNPTADKIDIWLVHPYVGLDIAAGASRLHPSLTLVSHMTEFHHAIGQYRWIWRQGYDAAQKVWNLGMDAIVPVWGDKIMLNAQCSMFNAK